MKAAFLAEEGIIVAGQTLTAIVEEGGAQVEMKIAGVCRTDLKMAVEGHRDLVLPRVLGHEGVGQIIESRCPLFRNGDWVAIYPGLFCGKCLPCRSGHTARCEDLKIFGFNEDGVFRTRMNFGKKEIGSLVPLPGTHYDDTIALIEPLACCLSGLRKVGNRKGTALVVGGGAVGSIFAALLKSEKWEQVVVVDKDIQRLNTELPMGVEAMHTSVKELIPALRKKGCDHEIDFVVPCCPEGLNWPFWEVMRPGGSVLFFSGGIGGNTILSVDMNAVHYLELSLYGSYGCNEGDFVSASNLLAENRIDLSFFDFYCVRLEDISHGMERLKEHSTKKVVINQF